MNTTTVEALLHLNPPAHPAPAASRGRIVLAEPSHGNEVTSLLRQSYGNSLDFVVTDEAHFALAFDGARIVLVVIYDDIVISTMQLKVAMKPSDLDHAHEVQLREAYFPGLYLQRAATAKDKRFSNLNSLLRLYCIEASITVGIRSLFGLVFYNGPRVRTMQSIGYELTPIKATSEPFLQYKSPCLFARLDVDANGASAASILRGRIDEDFRKSFNYDNETLREAIAARLRT